MKNYEELEMQRRNVTPSRFLSLVRSEIRKRGFTAISPDDLDLNYWAKGGDLEFDNNNKNNPSAPVAHERSVSRPYEMQTYIKQWNGDVYNLICEFTFWDAEERTGWGYFYFINKCNG